MSLMNDYENKALDALFGSGSPATLYLGLLTVDAAEDGTGFTEMAGSGYARVAVTNNATNFPAAAGNKANGTVIEWPATTGAWNNLIRLGVFEAASGGNPKATAPLTGAPVSIPAGRIPRLAIGAMVWTAD